MAKLDVQKIVGDMLDNIQQNPSISSLPISSLYTFDNHPFRLYQDDRLIALASDIEKNGLLQPIIVRPHPQHSQAYEIIAGHNRVAAARELLGWTSISAIVRPVNDADALWMMLSSNFHQRNEILPSEKARAYAMQLEAMKHQGKTSDHSEQKYTSRALLAQAVGENQQNIRRYIRLNHLISPLLQKVDDKRLGLLSAVSLSYLDTMQQEEVNRWMDEHPASSVRKQTAEQLKKQAQDHNLLLAEITEILQAPAAADSAAIQPAGQSGDGQFTVTIQYKQALRLFPSAVRNKQLSEKDAQDLIETALKFYFAANPIDE